MEKSNTDHGTELKVSYANMALLAASATVITVVNQSPFIQVSTEFFFKHAFMLISTFLILYMVTNIDRDFRDERYRSKLTCLFSSTAMMFMPSLYLVWTEQIGFYSAFVGPLDASSLSYMPLAPYIPYVFFFFLMVPLSMYRRPSYMY
jgi:hypothetical protein